jgi:hypothetical protein
MTSSSQPPYFRSFSDGFPTQEYRSLFGLYPVPLPPRSSHDFLTIEKAKVNVVVVFIVVVLVRYLMSGQISNVC